MSKLSRKRKPILAWLLAVVMLASTAAVAAEELLVYTALEDDEIPGYLELFKKAHPGIEVKIVRDSIGIITAKLLAEKDNPRADVVWGTADTSPYLLLTPGPLTTTATVKQAMLRDRCTWDAEYNALVQTIRARLTALTTPATGYTTVLMQGSGTFCVEAAVTTAVPRDGRLLVLANGAYGRRMAAIASRCGVACDLHDSGEHRPPDLQRLAQTLENDPRITHVGLVHCETTTGMLNPVEAAGAIVQQHARIFLVDAMSSFGGIPLEMAALGADYLVSSANKCIQGVPGFGFVIARRTILEQTRGQARSLCLDLYDQWRTMEEHHGKWRFTSPTRVVRAFAQALDELDAEGGIEARHRRYQRNHALLLEGMTALGFTPCCPRPCNCPSSPSSKTLGRPPMTSTASTPPSNAPVS